MDDYIDSTILAKWHASPLDKAQAKLLLVETQLQRKKAILAGAHCCLCQANEFIANYWLGKSGLTNVGMLRTKPNRALNGLLSLIYGQLLIASKLKPAFEYLDRGLIQSADFLTPTDYFRVVNRHELLSVLPLFEQARTAADLPTLENEARILARLKKGQPRLTGNSGSTPQR